MTWNHQSTAVTAPHVLIFPLPLQGPVNCMLKLAELLCHKHINVTFLNTEHMQQRVQNEAYFLRSYPNFRFETVPDGLPKDNPMIQGTPCTDDPVPKMIASMEAVSVPIFREMVTCGGRYGPDSDEPVTFIITDGLFTFATDIAKEIGVQLFYFETISPCCLWSYMCLPKLIEAGEIPFKDDNLDELITNAPAMENIIRRRDLPNFCRANNLSDDVLQLVLKEDSHIPLAQGLILNTFQELDAPFLSQFRNLCPKVYAVGPLHAHLKTRLPARTGPTTSNSMWQEDRSCISWLESQPPKSVIYVSIGSYAAMTKDQMLEIWHGLVKSGSRFLWVQRQGSVLGLDSASEFEIPSELSQGTKERGYIVSWAPQVEVLAHPAVGGFLTHSGWNSTLESIVEGKPMICWPFFVDQLVNSRYVGEVWKLGLDMKDTCDRNIVANMIKEVMELKKDEFWERADKVGKLAKASVTEGGSSFDDFDHLVEDIKLMKLPASQSQS